MDPKEEEGDAAREFLDEGEVVDGEGGVTAVKGMGAGVGSVVGLGVRLMVGAGVGVAGAGVRAGVEVGEGEVIWREI